MPSNTQSTDPQSAIDAILQETRRSTDSTSARTSTMLTGFTRLLRAYSNDPGLVNLVCDQIDRNAAQFGYAISQQAGQQTGGQQAG